ncbi:MAG: hypothetical protein MUO23_04570 [Anaerolineales bacterium]|nr:hypothetical protein [Anaerolineales bacterium]
MRTTLRTAEAVVVLGILLSGCNFTSASDASPQAAPQGELLAWVDAPLDGSRLPVRIPYPVVCHGADPGGVSAVEFRVNGSAEGEYPAADGTPLLLTASFNWLPVAPGRAVLECRARNASGIWSEPAEAVVIIEDGTPTFTPSPVLTLTATVTPTPTATVTLTPTPIPQTGFAGPPIFSPTQLNLPYDCPSSELAAEIKVAPGQAPRAVVLFYRITDKDFAERSEWASLVMNPVGADTYRVSFNPVRDGGFMTWLSSHWSTTWEGWLSTQFVIQGADGTYTRSDVYSQVGIGGCH